MDHATSCAEHGGHFWIDHDRQPLCLHLQSDMAVEENFQATTQTKRKSGEAVASVTDVSATDAAGHKRPHRVGPGVQNELVRKVALNLVENHSRTRAREALQMNIRLLPGPSNFDEIEFIEARADRNSVARVRIECDGRTGALNVLDRGEVDVGAISDERIDVNAKKLLANLSVIRSLLRAQRAATEDEDQGHE